MADQHEKISRIDKIDGDEETKQIDLIETLEEREVTRTAPANKDHFESLMAQGRKEASVTSTVDVDSDVQTSLVDEVRHANYRGVDTVPRAPEDLIAQAENTIKTIEDLKSKLTTPELELTPESQAHMRHSLSHIDETLRIALSKTGVETPELTTQTAVNPIDRFLGYLTHGQDQLQKIGDEIRRMQANNEVFSPAHMILVQIKVNRVQQELEFFTGMLNKALESTKTLMNVQV